MNVKKFNLKMGICSKLMVLTSIIILGVLSVFTSIQISSRNSLSKAILLDVLQPMANQSTKAVEANIKIMSDRISTLADNEQLLGTSTEVNEVLESAKSIYNFSGIGVYNPDGTAVATVGTIYDNLTKADCFNTLKSTDDIVISDPLILDNTVGIPVAAPVKSEGSTAVYLVGVYKYDVLGDVLNTIHIGETGMALIINSEGIIVGHPSTDVVLQNLNLYDLDKDPSAHSIFDRMVAKENGSAQGIVNGQDSYVAFAPISDTDWSLAIEVPTTDYDSIASESYSSSLPIILASLVVAFILIFAVTTIISKQLKKSITRINKLAEGDLTSDIEISNSNDETKILSLSLKSTVESINIYLTEIHRVLDNISKGNLNISADGEYRGDFIIVKESLTQIIDALNNVMKQINFTSYNLMQTATAMGNQSEKLHISAMNQTSSMKELTTEVSKIRDNLSDVTTQSDMNRQCACEIAQQITNGYQKMIKLQEAMVAISDSAEDISKISKNIEDIAQKTNLLALNASVEASRAGEAGRGFGVVALEVRNLANQSSTFAKNTVELIENTIELIAEGTALTEDASASLNEIIKGSDAVTEISGKLANSVNIQEEALVQITDKIADISTVTNENLQCAQNTSDVSIKLEKEAQNLKKILANFQFH